MQKKTLLICCILLLINISMLNGCMQEEKEMLKEAEVLSEEEVPEDTAEEEIFVYVCGAVAEQGVYELPQGSRIYEAVAAAGGMLPEAAPNYLNQAEQMTDGQSIFVPTQEEVENSYLEQMESNDENGKVNLNTASKEELMSLPGIGEAKAQSILDYRQVHGAFQSEEEIKQIEGIKDGVYNKIKDRISVR